MKLEIQIFGVVMTPQYSGIYDDHVDHQNIGFLVSTYGLITRPLAVALSDHVTLFVHQPGGKRANLVKEDGNPPYVRTSPDETLANNLLYLPGGPYHHVLTDPPKKTFSGGLLGDPPKKTFSGGLLGHEGIASGGIVSTARRAGLLD